MIGRLAGLYLILAIALVAQTAYYPAARHGANYMHNYYLPPAPSSTPWAPAWSPDGRWIAVAMHGSIWQIDPDTGAATELSYNSRYHSSPDWSPDGRWIVYTADEGHGRIQLEILNTRTGDSQRLTDDQQIYLDPVFSPDGSRLAYVSTAPNGYFNIYVRPVRDGRWNGEAVTLTRDNSYPRDRLYFGRWDMHTQPAWTRDSQELLFVSNRSVPLGAGHTWRMPAEADGIRKATVVLPEQSLYRTRPDVSIDGKRFIYSSTGGSSDQFSNLYVLPVEGGAPYKMTFGDYDHFHPRWSPDGGKVAYISNEGGLPQLWVLETYGGARRQIQIKDLRWKRPMGKLQAQVIDEESGSTTPARIQGQAADGKFYAPADTYSRLGISGHHFFHTEGEFMVDVPPGRITLHAIKGFEYTPATTEVEIRAGETTRAQVPLRRMANLSSDGWHSGSTHVHMNYGGNLRNTLENLIMMSRAEDQDIVNELVANKDNRILDYQYFVPGGGEHPVSKPLTDIKVLVGEEYRPPFYGHVFYLGLRDHLISPFTTGYEGTAIESLYPSNTDMFRKARAQGAVTGYVHPFSGDADPLEGNLGVAKAFPVDAALGTIDAMEWSNPSRAQLAVWHHALNNDLKITPTGGEDSITDLHYMKAIASMRTYAYTGKEFSITAWLDAVRKGHTFFSSGPLLDFRINNRLPGDSIRLPAGGGEVSINVKVRSIVPLSKIIVHRNGNVFREIPLSGDGKETEAEFKVTVRESGWFALYAEGPNSPLLDISYPHAGTNAIRVYAGEQKIRSKPSAAYFVRWIDKLQEMADEWPWWRSEAEKNHVFRQFQEARQAYERLAAEAQ